MMIVIGVDIHKRTHTCAAVDRASGRHLGGWEIPASDAGHLQALERASALGDGERVWALEDCRHVSPRLEAALLAAGEQVIRVAPSATGPSRRAGRQAGKSDEIDALAVARAVVRDGVDSFPAAFLDEAAMEIRVLVDHRDQLVSERTREVNRLRTQLVCLAPELEASLPARSLETLKSQNAVRRGLAKLNAGARVRVARAHLRRIVALTREIEALQSELDQLTRAHAPALRDENGVGPIAAAIIIGQTAGVQRFSSDAKFARQAGVAPIPASSGNTRRQRLDRGGNRQLNRALHVIATVRARHDPATRAYLQRKRLEGKSAKEALRSLKRHLARLIWRLLWRPTPSPAPKTVTTTSIGLTPCLT